MSEFSHPHDHAQQDRHDSQDEINHGGIGKYLVVFVALCLLTMCSFVTYFDFWRHHVPYEVSRALMMAVSCTKAMLVIMFFMHLLWEANWKWVLTIPATFMSIFLMLMLVPDIGWRKDNGYARYSDDRLRYAADPPSVEAAEVEAAEHELSHDPTH
ncbi:MAG: cytochrome C oxidase subunit IV family protein [Pirellulales bacterium]